MDPLWTISTDHHEIKLWVEAHNGKPEKLNREDAGSDEFILRFDFPGKKDNIYLGETLNERKIDWESFFKIFEDKNLALEYLKEYEGNSPDTAYRFVKRGSV